MRRILGFIVFVMGFGLACWLGYNLLIERFPATEGRNPLPAIIVALLFLLVGFKWMKGESA